MISSLLIMAEVDKGTGRALVTTSSSRRRSCSVWVAGGWSRSSSSSSSPSNGSPSFTAPSTAGRVGTRRDGPRSGRRGASAGRAGSRPEQLDQASVDRWGHHVGNSTAQAGDLPDEAGGQVAVLGGGGHEHGDHAGEVLVR